MRRTNTRTLGTMLGAIALLLGTATAHALDVCYQDEFGDVSVWKRFKLPRPGDCTPLTGHQHASWATLDGTICGTSDGHTLLLNFTYMTNAQGFGTGHYSVDRDDQRGIGNACDGRTDGNAWGCSSFRVWKTDCPRPTRVGP